MDRALSLSDVSIRSFGSDVCIEGYIAPQEWSKTGTENHGDSSAELTPVTALKRPCPKLVKTLQEAATREAHAVGNCRWYWLRQDLVAKSIGEAVGKQVVILGLDSYYLDRSDLPFEERAKINYDHPDAFDIPLLLEHLHKLMRVRRSRCLCTTMQPMLERPKLFMLSQHRIIIVEGILVLAIPALRDMMNVRIFVDTDADVRFIRRLSRDVKERGRSLQSVIDQYLNVVRLMHLEFVEPSKRYADIIVPEGGYNKVAIDFIVTKLKTLLDE